MITGTGGTEWGLGAEKDLIGSEGGATKAFKFPKPTRGVPMPLALGVTEEWLTDGGVDAAFQLPANSCLLTKDGVGIAGDMTPETPAGGKGTGGVGADATSMKRPGVLGVGPIGGGTPSAWAIPASLELALVARALCTAATAAAAVTSASNARMLCGRRAPTAATSSSNASKRARRSVRSISRSDAMLEAPCPPVR